MVQFQKVEVTEGARYWCDYRPEERNRMRLWGVAGLVASCLGMGAVVAIHFCLRNQSWFALANDSPCEMFYIVCIEGYGGLGLLMGAGFSIGFIVSPPTHRYREWKKASNGQPRHDYSSQKTHEQTTQLLLDGSLSAAAEVLNPYELVHRGYVTLDEGKELVELFKYSRPLCQQQTHLGATLALHRELGIAEAEQKALKTKMEEAFGASIEPLTKRWVALQAQINRREPPEEVGDRVSLLTQTEKVYS